MASKMLVNTGSGNQAITWTIVELSSMKFCGIHLTFLHEVL